MNSQKIIPFKERKRKTIRRSNSLYGKIITEGTRLSKSSKFFFYENQLYENKDYHPYAMSTINDKSTYERIAEKFQEKFCTKEYRITEINYYIYFFPEEDKKHFLLTKEGEKIDILDFHLIKIIPKIEIQYFCTGETQSIREIKNQLSENNVPISSTLFLNNESVKLKSIIQEAKYNKEIKSYYTLNMIISVNLKDHEIKDKDITNKYDLIDI